MTTPNDKTKALLAVIATDIDQVVTSMDHHRALFIALQDRLRDEDYLGAVDALDALTAHGQAADQFAQSIAQRFHSIRFIDTELWEVGARRHQEREIRKAIAELGPTQLRQELAAHETHCKQIGCQTSLVLRARLAELETC